MVTALARLAGKRRYYKANCVEALAELRRINQNIAANQAETARLRVETEATLARRPRCKRWKRGTIKLMAYNKFKKVAQLREMLGLEDLMDAWLPERLPQSAASHTLLEALQDASEEALGTEKAKSEYVIVPVLKELRRNNPNKFSIFSGYQFDVESKLGLTGYCDFILSAHPKKVEIDAPVFCLVEAKKGEVEEGFAQCGAEMYAAQLFNERHNNPQKVIYGCVTSAFSWAFLQLEEKTLRIDPNYVPLTFTEPERVLAVLQWILDESLATDA